MRIIKAVLDTNILLVSISSKSKYHWILQSLLKSDFYLYITNEILLEYEEIITLKYSKEVAQNIIKMLLVLPNVYLITPHYKWNLLKDIDDNKFIDCYVSSNSDYLVTNDKGFSEISDLVFPKINIVDIDEFKILLKGKK